jgi:hypothetical protein
MLLLVLAVLLGTSLLPSPRLAWPASPPVWSLPLLVLLLLLLLSAGVVKEATEGSWTDAMNGRRPGHTCCCAVEAACCCWEGCLQLLRMLLAVWL